MTTPGAVLGTVPYMAPEQLEGKDADARTDLFAFGCVLYEMLTGRRAFPGESEARVISAIMASEPPPVSSLQPVTPPALERLVTACLAKTPTPAARARTTWRRNCEASRKAGKPRRKDARPARAAGAGSCGRVPGHCS